MAVHDTSASAPPDEALAYAWWLTGDPQTASAAVRRAAASPAVTDAGPDERLTVLLRAVRDVAAPAPTMCPASELALLHDGHGLALDVAARVAAIDDADARTELAHGRLEALPETVVDPFSHPERLGGLAVGNPADVAHTRQCDSCRQARQLVLRGRTEVRRLAAPVAAEPVDAGSDEAPGVTYPLRWLVAMGLAALAILVTVALLAVRATAAVLA